jgi:hypothetical protein
MKNAKARFNMSLNRRLPSYLYIAEQKTQSLQFDVKGLEV